MRARDVFDGVSVAAFARGSRRMLTPLTTRHAHVSADHAKILADLRERRTKARQIKDPEERAAALEALKEERPTHPTLVAAGCTVASAVVGWPLLNGHHTVVLAGSATLWAMAALVLGQAPDQDADPTPGDQADGAPEDHGPTEEDHRERGGQAPVPTAPTGADARRAVAVLGAGGTHVALTAVTAHLASAHPLWKRSGKAVRVLLREARVEVRGGVRVEGVSVPGVHRDDVPPLPCPADSTPVGAVVAGHSNNNNANNSEWTTREGFVMRAHPDEPARTIVVRRQAETP